MRGREKQQDGSPGELACRPASDKTHAGTANLRGSQRRQLHTGTGMHGKSGQGSFCWTLLQSVVGHRTSLEWAQAHTSGRRAFCCHQQLCSASKAIAGKDGIPACSMDTLSGPFNCMGGEKIARHQASHPDRRTIVHRTNGPASLQTRRSSSANVPFLALPPLTVRPSYRVHSLRHSAGRLGRRQQLLGGSRQHRVSA